MNHSMQKKIIKGKEDIWHIELLKVYMEKDDDYLKKKLSQK